MSSQTNTKIVYLARRNPALSREEFPARWRQHSLLSGTMASIRPGFSQVAQCVNLYDRTVVPRATLAYDGVNLLTLTDPSFASSIWQSDEFHDLILPDELGTFSGYVRHFTLTAQETVVAEGPMRPLCLVSFLKRDRKLSLDRFGDTLVSLHGEVVRGSRRGVVNLVTDRQPGYNFDAITELWFHSEADAIGFTQSPAYADSYLAGRYENCDEARTVTMMTRVTYARPSLEPA